MSYKNYVKHKYFYKLQNDFNDINVENTVFGRWIHETNKRFIPKIII